MKFFLSILLLVSIKTLLAQSQNDAFQEQVNINVKQKSVQDVLENVEQETNIMFSYSNSTINSDSIISIFVFKGKLEGLLKKLLPSGTSYILNSNNIILYNSPLKEKKSTEEKKSNNKSKAVVKNSSKEDKNTLDSNKMDLPPIRPFLIKKIELNSIEEDGELATIISLSPILVKTINEEDLPHNIIDNKKTKKTYRKRGRQINTSFSRNKKATVEYSIRPFYQLIKETIQYKNFGIGENDERIKAIINSSEENPRAFRTGILATVTSDNLRFTTGLAIYKSYEDYNYQPANDSIYSYLVSIPDTVGFVPAGKNMYRYFSVPLFIGYERNISSNFIVCGNIGAWFNKLNSYSGEYLDLDSGIPYKFSDLKNAPLNKIKTDLALDISVEYKVLKNTSISFSTSYIYPINSIFSDEYPVTKYKSAVGYSFTLIQKF
jgi:hypothetical protein